MKISLKIELGAATCKSSFYTAFDIAQNEYTFTNGINFLHGEIDDGGFYASYIMSMYCVDTLNCNFYNATVTIDGEQVCLRQLCNMSCYIDPIYPLFSSDRSIKDCVKAALERNKTSLSCDDVRNIFMIDRQRFEMPLSGTGNEKYKAMSDIGYVNQKDIYCFPWFSKKRFDSLHRNMTDLLEILDNLNKTVILPLGH